MAWIPVLPVIAIRMALAARANLMATSPLVHAARVAHVPAAVQVAHAQAVRARVARALMATVVLVVTPVIAAHAVKAVTAQVRVRVAQHVPRVRMDIRATRQISRPITPIQAASIRTANARVAIALPLIVQAKDHVPVVRVARSPVVPVDRNQAAHAAAIAEPPTDTKTRAPLAPLLFLPPTVRHMQRCRPSTALTTCKQ